MTQQSVHPCLHPIYGVFQQYQLSLMLGPPTLSLETRYLPSIKTNIEPVDTYWSACSYR